MVNIEELRVGDRVKIVDQWTGLCAQNNQGRMDHWLGSVMTVRRIANSAVFMEEDQTEHDGPGWFWNKHCIDRVVAASDEAFYVCTEEELSTLLQS